MRSYACSIAVIGLISAASSFGGVTPEEVVHTYVRAMADQRINIVADCMHPSALQHFKKIMVEIANGVEAAPPERRPPEKMLNALFGEGGPQSMRDAEPREAFVRFMSNLVTFLPQVREMHAGSEYQVIGHVDEGGNITHVVYRATLRRGPAELHKMDVLSLKRDGEDWKLLLSDDLESLVSGLGKRIATPSPAPSQPPKPADPKKANP
jgi:hypothetical protein